MNYLAFDIETVPDVELGRKIYDLGTLSDDDVARVMFFKQRQARNTEFLPVVQHRVVAISVVLRSADSLKVWSLGSEEAGEEELVRRFFEGIERYVPTLVSWNGSGFDLPVLHYRALRYGIVADRYWDTGDGDREFRFNNYIGRFHWRHVDVMDVMSGYQMSGRASLEHACLLLDLPGKLGMSGDRVWDAFRGGELAAIRAYCETDALNTYLIFLRFQLMRGHFDVPGYEVEIDRVRELLAASDEQHLRRFLEAWP